MKHSSSVSRTFAILLSIFALVACHVSVKGGAKATGDAKSNAGGSSKASAGAGSSKGSKSTGNGGGKFKFGWKSRAKLTSNFKWSKPVCEHLGPPKKPRPFRGVVKVKGGANVSGKASAKGSAKASAKASAKGAGKQGPTKDPKKDPKGKTTKKDPKKPDQKEISGRAEQPNDLPEGKVPSEDELSKPIPPPDKPSDNVFGYDKPVAGCFEGEVFFIAKDTKRLPQNYDDLQASTVLYACEWDIPTRKWEQGFPGIKDRFEWFAIRYSGVFAVEKAGRYEFRLSSDDGTKLIIDGKVVIDNDGQHAPKEKTGKVKLDAGDHEMVLEYFQGPRYHINLQLYVTPPGDEEGLFSVR
jgi:hypothetical protein